MSTHTVPSFARSFKAIRGAFIDFIGDPFYVSELESVRYIADGLMILEDGKIKEFGTYAALKDQYSDLAIVSYPDMLISPGFIDVHIHFPQAEMIAAYGEQLLGWLENYTFPTEGKFRDSAYSQQVAAIFLDELLRNGTTTALVLAAVYPESVDALFEEANRRNLRLIAGKVMMDRNAPDFLRDTAESSYQESKQLIEKWHKKDDFSTQLHLALPPLLQMNNCN